MGNVACCSEQKLLDKEGTEIDIRAAHASPLLSACPTPVMHLEGACQSPPQQAAEAENTGTNEIKVDDQAINFKSEPEPERPSVSLRLKPAEDLITKEAIELEDGKIYIGQWNLKGEKEGFGIMKWDD